MATKITWTEETWNPTTGCTPVSAGCRNCYAEALHNRRHRAYLDGKRMSEQYAKPFEEIQLLGSRLKAPFRWRKPRLVFVGSMMDLFHPDVPEQYIARVFKVMNDCPRHTFQVLTKRPERAAECAGPWTENIWMGTTVEDRKTVYRMDVLRRYLAGTRFISFEPLLESVGELDLEGIQWAIVGGESGGNRRPLDQAWAREIRDQCLEQGVAFFFKQDSGPRPGMRPWVVEEDGSGWGWKQYPGRLLPPERVHLEGV